MITEKEHIHILTIKREGEQQLFQIKLPKNAKKITGILITAQPSNNQQANMPPSAPFNMPTTAAVKAGDIKLQLNNRKDIFYAEDVCAFELLPDYEGLTGIQRADFDDGGFGTRGSKLIPLKVEIETKDTIIGGYYKDTMPVQNLFPYQLKIYITYEIEE